MILTDRTLCVHRFIVLNVYLTYDLSKLSLPSSQISWTMCAMTLQHKTYTTWVLQWKTYTTSVTTVYNQSTLHNYSTRYGYMYDYSTPQDYSTWLQPTWLIQTPRPHSLLTAEVWTADWVKSAGSWSPWSCWQRAGPGSIRIHVCTIYSILT